MGRIECNKDDKLIKDLINDLSLKVLHEKIELSSGVFTINYGCFVSVISKFVIIKILPPVFLLQILSIVLTMDIILIQMSNY